MAVDYDTDQFIKKIQNQYEDSIETVIGKNHTNYPQRICRREKEMTGAISEILLRVHTGIRTELYNKCKNFVWCSIG